MAKNYCIPAEFSKTLKEAARNGEFSIESLYEMNSTQRNDLFSSYTDRAQGAEINAAFEKAMVSNQQDALNKWVTDTFSTTQKKSDSYYKIVAQIEKLEETGVLGEQSDGFLADLVAQSMGVTLSAEEVQTIKKKAELIEERFKAAGALGDPQENQEAQIAYFEALDEMNEYVHSLAPSSDIKILSSVIGRGNLLFRVSSPVLNILSNTFWGSYQAVERRLLSGSVGGVNTAFAKEYVKFTVKIHQRGGFDISRMTDLSDQQRVLGETQPDAAGTGLIRKAGRFYEDVVFKQLMGAPDVAGAAIAFADSANMESTLIAKRVEGLSGDKMKARALEVFKDAARVDPLTLEGRLVREKAIADATMSTFTNDTKWSEVGLAIRGLINKATGDVSLGDQLMPFVKTPANVVAAGIDISGVLTMPEFVIRGVRTFWSMRQGNTFSEATREEFKGFARKAVRAGFGMTVAFILAAGIDPDDFIGEYDSDERELNKLKSGVNNAIKIGDKWVSLDYFGPLATGFVAIMYARKYGNSATQKAWQYYRGASSQFLKVPGLETSKDLVTTIADFSTGKTKLEELPEETLSTAVDFLRARLVPGIVSDFAKMTDDFERNTKNQGTFARFKASLPFLREDLPIAKDTLGNQIETQPALSQLFFGSRVKEGKNSVVIEELDRLSRANNMPSLTYAEETSTRFPQLKEQRGEEAYQKAVDAYYSTFEQGLTDLVTNGRYTLRRSGESEDIKYKYANLSDEEKKAAINKLKADVLDEILKDAGYKTPRK